MRGEKALVDEADFQMLSAYQWRAKYGHGRVYVAASCKRVTIWMHRCIMGITDPGIPVDHRNGNGLDNQRSNLRVATTSNNGANQTLSKANTTGFKGAWFNGKSWYARLTVRQRHYYNGPFATAFEAALAYDRLAVEQFGEFAKTNAMIGTLNRRSR